MKQETRCKKVIWIAMAISVFMAMPSFAAGGAENGSIQTQVETAGIMPVSESDFIVSGNNSVTINNADNSVITNWARAGYLLDQQVCHSFINGDSLVTARGITFGNTKNDVMEKYGNAESQAYASASDPWYQILVASGSSDASSLAVSASVMEYFTKPYGLRFYFDQQDKLTGIVYFRDLVRNDESAAPVLLNEGYYYYVTTDIYDSSSQSMIHQGEVVLDHNRELYDAALEKDRYPFGLMADPVTDMKIAKVTDSAFTAYYEQTPEMESYFDENTAWAVSFYRDNDKWKPADSGCYWIVRDSDTFTYYENYDKIDWGTGAVTGHYLEARTYKRIP